MCLRLPQAVARYLEKHPEIRPSDLAERLLRSELRMPPRALRTRTNHAIYLTPELLAALEGSAEGGKWKRANVSQQIRAAMTRWHEAEKRLR